MENIDLLEFLPDKIKCGKRQREYPLNVNSDDSYIFLSYITKMAGCVRPNTEREYSLVVPRYIGWNQKTFEILGLLQAEMGKTANGCIVFCNHEPRLIAKVMKWFDKELEIGYNKWRWYIKANINAPQDKNYKKEIEAKIINHWLSKIRIDPKKNHPKTVTYIKNTKNKKLRFYDYGTLIIEYKSNLLSQIIKRYVKLMSYKVTSLGKEEIQSFMRGILAGESCVEIDKISGRFRVHLTVSDKNERDLYQDCLNKLGINIIQYENYKEMIMSKRENNIKLLKQRLMCLSPKKYNKFLYMMMLYKNVRQDTGYFVGNKKPWNKISTKKTDEILKLHYKNPNWPCWKIAEKVDVSTITISRVRKKHNLGKRLTKTPKETIKKIVGLRDKNPSAHAYEIANKLGLHRSRVERIFRKYKLKKQLQRDL